MGYAITAAVAFAFGVIVCWIYKAKAQAEIQKEIGALKASATKALTKL